MDLMRLFSRLAGQRKIRKTAIRSKRRLTFESLASRTLLAVDLSGWRTEATDGSGWGELITVDSQIVKYGEEGIGPFQMQWFLSRDRFGSKDDVLLRLADGALSYQHVAMPDIGVPNQTSYPYQVTLQLPKSRPTGWKGEDFSS